MTQDGRNDVRGVLSSLSQRSDGGTGQSFLLEKGLGQLADLAQVEGLEHKGVGFKPFDACLLQFVLDGHEDDDFGVGGALVVFDAVDGDPRESVRNGDVHED